MDRIPSDGKEFAASLRTLFPDLALAGVTVRTLNLAPGGRFTLAYIDDLLGPDDLKSLVLDPAARGLPKAPPAELVRACLLPVPEARTAADFAALRDGLLEGYIVIHADGYAQALLVRNHPGEPPKGTFGPDVRANRALLRRNLPDPGLQVKNLKLKGGCPACVACIAGKAEPEALQAMTDWVAKLTPEKPNRPLWKQLVEVFRLPPTLETNSPTMVAEALRRGYVAALAAHVGGARIGPVTLDLLLTGPNDHTLQAAVRGPLKWVRLLAVLSAMLLGPAFVAVTSYHHTLLPGPFLVALAAHRSNLPFPIVVEVFLIQLIDDAMWGGARLIGGRRWAFFASLGTILFGTAAFSSGLLAPISAAVGLVQATAFQLLPMTELNRRLRIWRAVFTFMGVGLGMFGISLLVLALVAYLGQEEHFGQPLRREPRSIT